MAVSFFLFAGDVGFFRITIYYCIDMQDFTFSNSSLADDCRVSKLVQIPLLLAHIPALLSTK